MQLTSGAAVPVRKLALIAFQRSAEIFCCSIGRARRSLIVAADALDVCTQCGLSRGP